DSGWPVVTCLKLIFSVSTRRAFVDASIVPSANSCASKLGPFQYLLILQELLGSSVAWEFTIPNGVAPLCGRQTRGKDDVAPPSMDQDSPPWRSRTGPCSGQRPQDNGRGCPGAGGTSPSRRSGPPALEAEALSPGSRVPAAPERWQHRRAGSVSPRMTSSAGSHARLACWGNNCLDRLAGLDVVAGLDGGAEG